MNVCCNMVLMFLPFGIKFSGVTNRSTLLYITCIVDIPGCSGFVLELVTRVMIN